MKNTQNVMYMSGQSFYAQHYQGSKNKFPVESFLIAGISNYQALLTGIDSETLLTIKPEPTNVYDKNAIAITYNEQIIGYVPKYAQQTIRKYIEDDLCILSIECIKGIKGIRVVPKSLFGEEQVFQKS